ncbi:MAG: calcium-binding protein [Oscillatoriales cyanobacterium RM1_1_9]|nr:calcium-binding protein [Oscillatoriales cyanobacterium RM1_1_9]
MIVDTQGNNQIFGNLGDDLIFGGVGNDLIYGGQDNDNLSGDVGDDFLSGDKGDDLLVGVSFASANPGRGELDTLSGGAGIDVFALGDATRTYYLGTGLNDVALLIDFAPAEDLIAVSTTNNLSISAFSLAGIGEGTGIFSSGDLIAFAPGIGADQITIGVNVFPVPIPNT